MRLHLTLLLPLLAAPALAGGNVLVSIQPNGDVVVTGDSESNDIIHEAEGELAIRGRDGTTVNGSTEPFFLPPVTGRYRIDLGPGDDRFETSTVLRPSSTILMGEGDDRVGIGNSTAFGKGLTIDTGDGDDLVDIQDSAFGRLKISTGDGNDEVSFFFVGAERLGVRTGDGDDDVVLNRCTFSGPVSIIGGGGEDHLDEGVVDYLGGPPLIRGFEPAKCLRP